MICRPHFASSSNDDGTNGKSEEDDGDSLASSKSQGHDARHRGSKRRRQHIRTPVCPVVNSTPGLHFRGDRVQVWCVVLVLLFQSHDRDDCGKKQTFVGPSSILSILSNLIGHRQVEQVGLDEAIRLRGKPPRREERHCQLINLNKTKFKSA